MYYLFELENYMVKSFSFNLASFTILLFYSHLYPVESIRDVSQLSVGCVHKIYSPRSVAKLRKIVQQSEYPISVKGRGFSQGGHIWCNGGITIDMTNINRIINLDFERKKITVEAGATWYKVQKYINSYGLSIRVMQSYNDFTIGGSLSVNIHSRAIQDGTLIETVESIKLLLADGSIVTASRIENNDLFKAAIGGYGAIGIIIEATFLLTDNEIIEEKEVIMPIDQYFTYFDEIIKNDPKVVFHNANLYPDTFNRLSSITWYKTNKLCTIKDRIQKNEKVFCTFDYFSFQLVRYIQALQKIRLPIHALKNTEKVVWRNYEMSGSVASVEPFSRIISTAVLQEYFVPYDKLYVFIQHLKEVVQKYKVNMMNISLRYIYRDTESIMAYAQSDESFALVCYINMRNSESGMKKARKWTQELIDRVIDCGGTYFLPYQLHATKKQFRHVYPGYKELLEIKNKVDPNNRFMNSFLQKYIVS